MKISQEFVNKAKVTLAVIFAKVYAWVIEFSKAMWEEYLKEKLDEQIHEAIKVLVKHVKEYRSTEEYKEKKEYIYNNVFTIINLPKFLIPFKGLIKNILKDNISKRIDKALENIDEKLK